MDLFFHIFKGFLIGIIVSAPMGPVGLLCLKETLKNGRKDGFLTGIGAAMSDSFYGIVSYLSIGLILSFIESHTTGITFVGTILLVAMSIYLYITVPQELDFSEEQEIKSLHGFKKITTAFIITLSNPLIIFFFLSFYTRFNFVEENFDIFTFFISIASLAGGCLAWWYTLTRIVTELKTKMKWKYVRAFNKLLAIIVAVIAAYGFISSCIDLFNGKPF